ncbi:GIY-YIG nuclease family protein [Trichocoleus sp. FACHB-591]|uniref:GIY-YIG nuclease family protein n=1 Tax=Trichocoleus sp. FACHB-591 TaxID=2692872 RepID=UPI0018EF8009|nr:hypothetical protein [Trichocoleus sp. FACHB-591]
MVQQPSAQNYLNHIDLFCMHDRYSALIQPAKLWSRAEVLEHGSSVPKSAGIYAWYFRNVPSAIPTDDCLTCQGLTLLYAGISPSKPAGNRTLKERIRKHLTSNAYGSTLRLSLGCLLGEELGIELRRVGNSGTRLTFSATGEQKLNHWLDSNAFVTWMLHGAPWEVEPELLKTVSFPLNLDHNEHHPFQSKLATLRAEAKARARLLPVVPE